MMSHFILCLLVVFLAADCLHGQPGRGGKRAKDVMNKKELTAAVLELQDRIKHGVRAPLTSCPTGWASYQSSCYGVGTEEVSWAEAQEFCGVYGGHLAEVDDSAENTFVKDLLRNKGVDVWLGGTDIFEDGQWTWASTGQALGFTDFDDGQATQNGGGSEDCIVAPGFADYKWHDYPCGEQKYFICEIKLA